jgi:diguanylate cyclase
MTTKSLLLKAAAGAVGATAFAGGYAAGRASLQAELAAVRAELAEAQRAMLTDSLTGIANRAGLEADWARRACDREFWSLVMVDLDGFKQVNDTHDHGVGDAVLVEVARRLGLVAEPGRDLVGRLGGDEFLVTVGGDQGNVVARHVGLVLARPIPVGALRLSVTASVGVVQAVPGDDVRAVLHSADLAMYGAKRGGKNRVCEFDPTTELADVLVERPGERTRDRGVLAGVRR